MLARHSLNKLDASKIFPVSHSLFEESFMRARKISIDFIRNHTVIPDALLSCRCGSLRSSSTPLKVVIRILISKKLFLFFQKTVEIICHFVQATRQLIFTQSFPTFEKPIINQKSTYLIPTFLRNLINLLKLSNLMI